ncbi:hypothetical protein LB504_000244 [Fusarium proliferatum]|nr:hypothetical protein LB504_000244 [Fusarium proliferatum]
MSNLSAKPGTFFCDHCDPKVRFASEKELCDHLWLDHMACGHCGRVFETFELKKQHDTEAHNRCAVCYRFFVSMNMEIRKEVHISRGVLVLAERVPTKREIIPVTRVTPTTRPVIFAPYPPRPTFAPVPENK